MRPKLRSASLFLDSVAPCLSGRHHGVARVVRAVFAFTLGGGLFATAAAQRDLTIKKPPGDTAAEKPISEAEAVAAGVKLLGVFDATTGSWVDRATVRDTLGNQTLTSNIGVAALSVLEPVLGQYLIEIRKEGYSPQLYKFKADTAAEFLVGLTPNPLGKATALPAVVTTESRRLIGLDPGQREGFFTRCGMSVVECVGRKDLDLHPTGHLVDLLSRKEGVTRMCSTVSRPSFSSAKPQYFLHCQAQMLDAVNGGYCSPTYFLNGFEWSTLGGQGQDQLDQFLIPKHIAGMEVYLPDMPRPGRFEIPGANCGAVVIWTQ